MSPLLRGMRRRQQLLELRPVENIVEGASPGTWVATQSPPRFTLVLSSGIWPGGWVLLDSNLVRRSADHSAFLFLDTGAWYTKEVLPVATVKLNIIFKMEYGWS